MCLLCACANYGVKKFSTVAFSDKNFFCEIFSSTNICGVSLFHRVVIAMNMKTTRKFNRQNILPAKNQPCSLHSFAVALRKIGVSSRNVGRVCLRFEVGIARIRLL